MPPKLKDFEKKVSKSISWKPELIERLQLIANEKTDGNVSMLVGIYCKEYLEKAERTIKRKGQSSDQEEDEI